MKFQELKAISTEVERGKDYIILRVNDEIWYGGRYIAYSNKWDCGEYVDNNTLKEAREFITKVNSKDPISPEVIYNSKVINETTEIPSWLSEYIGLNTYDLEDIKQSDITIKLHSSEHNIDVMSVWYSNLSVMIALRGADSYIGTDLNILVTDNYQYQNVVRYLYNKYIEKRLQEAKVISPTEPNKDISLMWGYFIEDLLEKEYGNNNR
jgi:hypothetical protein